MTLNNPPGKPDHSTAFSSIPPTERAFPLHGISHPLHASSASPDHSGQRLPRSSFAWLAWLLILAMTIGAMVLQQFRADQPESSQLTDDSLHARILELQGKLFFALSNDPTQPVPFQQIDDAFNNGPVAQRQRFICLVGEFSGPQRASESLADLDSLIQQGLDSGELDPQQLESDLRAQAVLHKLYDIPENLDAAPPSSTGEPQSVLPLADVASTSTGSSADSSPAILNPDERRLLADHLGFFGKIALNPRNGPDVDQRKQLQQSALFTAVLGTSLVIVVGILGIAGFCGLVTLLILAFLRKLKPGILHTSTNTGVYAETFAIWSLLFLALQFAAALLADQAPQFGLLPAASAFLLSLFALAWPVLRGVHWSQVRSDIGWTAGRRHALEPFLGLPAYIMVLPILAVGIILTLILAALSGALAANETRLFDSPTGPAHPIVEILLNGSWSLRATIFFVACICAPVVEETFFRGVLYRQLRGATPRIGLALSVIFSALVSSLIFAAIHPQGWIAIPALASLAFGFCLVREWRGTILPCIIMHGLNNGIVLSLAMFFL